MTQDVPMLMFEDQFGQRHETAALRGDVLVLLFGDKASAEANKQLGELLHVQFHPTARGLPPKEARKAPVTPLPGVASSVHSPEVRVVAVACIGQVPAMVRPLIRMGFRSGSPDVPVWLDFSDQMKKSFGFTAGVTNLVVLDRGGRIRANRVGSLDTAHFAELVALIERLRGEEP